MENGSTDSSDLEAESSKSVVYKQRGAFVAVPLEFLEKSGNLSAQARWLCIVLWRFVTVTESGEIPGIFPSYDKLREITGFRRAAIAKAIRELTAAGWIIKRRRFSKSTIYYLRKSVSSSESGTISSSKSGTTVQ